MGAVLRAVFGEEDAIFLACSTALVSVKIVSNLLIMLPAWMYNVFFVFCMMLQMVFSATNVGGSNVSGR